MRFDIITIFPELFTGVLECGILRRARQSGLVDIRIVNLRDFAKDSIDPWMTVPMAVERGWYLCRLRLFEAIEFCRR